MARATLTAAELAEILGVSEWSIYESVRRGDCPVSPIRVGRRLVWSCAAVDALLSRSSSIQTEAVAEIS